jgi:hypothetical protein
MYYCQKYNKKNEFNNDKNMSFLIPNLPKK